MGGLFDGKADLGLDSPMKAVLKLSIPSMGLFVFNGLLHLVDTIFVSWLGELPMAAMSFTGPVNMCIFATLECVVSGAIALMGRHLGRGDIRSARHIALSSLALMYVVCFVSLPLILPYVSNLLFGMLGAGGDGTLLDLCWQYNMWVPIMLPFMGYTWVANTTFRAQGDTMTPFKSIAMANTLNIILDPLFIFVFNWGIGGAAIATWFSRIACSYYLLHKLRKNSSIILPVVFKPRKRLMNYWGPVLWIGIPVGLSTASAALGMGSVNRILSTFGHRVVASWMLGLRVEELAFNFAMGINTAFIPFVAFNYGKRDPERMKSGLRAALILSLTLMGAMGIVIYAFPQFFLGIFRPTPEIGEMAALSIRASVPGYPFNIFMVVTSGFFVGTGYSIFGTITQLLRSIVFRVSAAWLFARFLPLSQIWWFQSLAFFLGSFVALIFLLHVFRRIRRDFMPKNHAIP
ncbi:MAG: MATE family efflux transporter [Synergistaceae bacterium]|nr:MATE family efflux transporter [Synergistaceae bacterium]